MSAPTELKESLLRRYQVALQPWRWRGFLPSPSPERTARDQAVEAVTRSITGDLPLPDRFVHAEILTPAEYSLWIEEDVWNALPSIHQNQLTLLGLGRTDRWLYNGPWMSRRPSLTLSDYQIRATRTWEVERPDHPPLINAAFGLMGETGEVIDYLKKALFHGHPLNSAILSEELGDLLWYLSACATAAGIDLGTVGQDNLAKIQRRYPQGFDSMRSRNRPE